MKLTKYMILFLLAAILLSACSYSFTGASIPPHLKTLAIPPIKDKSGKGEPNLGIDLTNMLIDKFVEDNSFTIVKKGEADAILECTISSFREEPAVISGSREKATEKKIRITVKALYRDLVKRKTILEKNFSLDRNYPINQQAARKAIIEEIIEGLSENVLLDVVANW